MGFKQWLEDYGTAYSLDIDVDKRPMHLKNPLTMPPADRQGRHIEKEFGVKRRPKASASLLVANDKFYPKEKKTAAR